MELHEAMLDTTRRQIEACLEELKAHPERAATVMTVLHQVSGFGQRLLQILPTGQVAGQAQLFGDGEDDEPRMMSDDMPRQRFHPPRMGNIVANGHDTGGELVSQLAEQGLGALREFVLGRVQAEQLATRRTLLTLHSQAVLAGNTVLAEQLMLERELLDHQSMPGVRP